MGGSYPAFIPTDRLDTETRFILSVSHLTLVLRCTEANGHVQAPDSLPCPQHHLSVAIDGQIRCCDSRNMLRERKLGECTESEPTATTVRNGPRFTSHES
eukprot:scaffold204860_cov29-Tisochrysis_lutea.AAC.5